MSSRFYHLARTSVHILRTRGIRAFTIQSIRWLRGKRRYHRFGSPKKLYRLFQQRFEPTSSDLERQTLESRTWDFRPVFSIVTAVYNPQFQVFREAVESILNQSYENWAWHIADASTDESIWQFLAQQAASDPRIKPIKIQQNRGISINTNAVLRAASGDYIVMFDHDDCLAPFALYAVAKTIRNHPNADFIYSDADKLDERGQRCQPLFKPDWSPEMMLSVNLLCQLSVFKRCWLEQVGLLNQELDGAQDWDLCLRIIEKAKNIYHIPQILYHWRMEQTSTALSSDAKPYIRKAQQTALTDHLIRLGLKNPRVIFDDNHPIQKMYPFSQWELTKNWKVSIVIPSRDNSRVLEKCLKSLFNHTAYPNFEVLLVDNGSVEPETQHLYSRYKSCYPNFRVIDYPESLFNFSKVCNWGAAHSDGDLLLFLNNDTEILHSDWLTLMVQWFELQGVGIVGPKLLYPNGTIQHAGVIVGLGGLASHLFTGEAENIGTVFGTDGWYRNLLAVTAACLMISRQAYAEVDGFDEEYRLNFSDVDLCLRVHAAGYRIVYTPHVRLVHYESVSHGRRIPRTDFERADHRWRHWLDSGDPFFNNNLTYRSALPRPKIDEIDSSARTNRDIMGYLPKKEILLLPDDLR